MIAKARRGDITPRSSVPELSPHDLLHDDWTMLRLSLLLNTEGYIRNTNDLVALMSRSSTVGELYRELVAEIIQTSFSASPVLLVKPEPRRYLYSGASASERGVRD